MALGAILGQTPTGGVSNIEIGSYIGDGSYGQNHPTIISTNGKAKLLMIVSDNTIQTANAQNSYETWFTAEITEYRGYFQNSDWPIYVEWEETGISIWSDGNSAHLQFNNNGKTFYYTIFY